MGIPAGLIHPYYYSGGGGEESDWLIVWVMGDSHATKRPSGAYGPTPTSGTVYQWDTSEQELYEISNTDILGGDADNGSVFPQLGIELNLSTGKKIVFVTSGTGGSNYSPRTGDTGDWTDADTLWSTAKDNFDDCVSFMSVTYPDANIEQVAYVILGVNDVRGATALATIQTDIDNFYDRITTAYPSLQIGLVLPGRTEVTTSDNRLSNIRNYLIQAARDYSNVYVACTEAHLWSAGYYLVDNLHLSQDGNDEALAPMMARWYNNSAYSKWARALISSHLDELSSARKTLISNLITALGDDFFELEYAYNFKTTLQSNCYLDLALLGTGFQTNGGFTANSFVTANGTNGYWRTGHIASINNVRASVNDFFDGVKIKTNRTAQGVLAIAFGAAQAAQQTVIGQTASNTVYYRAHDLTTNLNADTKLQDDTFYAVYRNGTTKGLNKNGVSDASAVVSSVAITAVTKYIGCINSNGTAQIFLDADYEYSIGGRFTTVDMAVIYSAFEALVDNW